MLRAPAFHPGAADYRFLIRAEGGFPQDPSAFGDQSLQRTAIGVFHGSGELQTGKGGGIYKDIGEEAILPHIQPNLPVQPSVGQIVNNKAEGRDLAVFCGIQLHSNQVFTA